MVLLKPLREFTRFIWWMQTKRRLADNPQIKQPTWTVSPPEMAATTRIHHRHLLLLGPTADTHFSVPRRVEGWVDLYFNVVKTRGNNGFWSQCVKKRLATGLRPARWECPPNVIDAAAECSAPTPAPLIRSPNCTTFCTAFTSQHAFQRRLVVDWPSSRLMLAQVVVDWLKSRQNMVNKYSLICSGWLAVQSEPNFDGCIRISVSDDIRIRSFRENKF